MSVGAPQGNIIPLQRKDFVSDQEVRWCPGCGDYSILAQTQKVMPELGVPRENIVFISGIGCSSRLPYYMNTYGFHSIHGRAPTIASGLKATRPELQVFVITGDGDGLSIGGNHLLHVMRRNIDLTIILFNNRIYGLTKGQYSPTSEIGKRTKSSPYGTIDYPLNPLSVALGAEATFVARSLDIDQQHLVSTIERAAKHKGTSFIEVYQNCNVFNDGAFMEFADKAVRPDRILFLEHGKPMVFGKDRDKGIRMNGMQPEVVTLGNGITEADLLVHDETIPEPAMAFMMTRTHWPDFPEPLGVFRAVERPTYDALMQGQIDDATEREGPGDFSALLNEGEHVDRGVAAARNVIVCPDCRSENIEGTDVCVVCGADLGQLKAPRIETALEERLASAHLRDIAVNKALDVSPGDPVFLAVHFMREHNAECVLVRNDDQQIVGILSERDILMKAAGAKNDLMAMAVKDIMTPDPVMLRADDTIAVALHKMAVGGFRHIPYVDHDGTTLMVSIQDVFHHVAPYIPHR